MSNQCSLGWISSALLVDYVNQLQMYIMSRTGVKANRTNCSQSGFRAGVIYSRLFKYTQHTTENSNDFIFYGAPHLLRPSLIV
jgi:hypothetical protein